MAPIIKVMVSTCNFSIEMKSEGAMVAPLFDLGVYLGVLIASTPDFKTRV